jgi:hypothetical protein
VRLGVTVLLGIAHEASLLILFSTSNCRQRRGGKRTLDLM